VNDDELSSVGWFALDALPEITSWSRLRIEAAMKDEPRAWFAEPGSYYEELGSPDALG
jgi:8-oxo-dGTP diphosphatase